MDEGTFIATSTWYKIMGEMFARVVLHMNCENPKTTYEVSLQIRDPFPTADATDYEESSIALRWGMTLGDGLREFGDSVWIQFRNHITYTPE